MSIKGLKAKSDAALASIPEGRATTDNERPMRATTSPGATALMQPTIDALNDRAKEAEARVVEYEKKLAKTVSELPLDALVMTESRKRKLTTEQFEELKANLDNNPLVHPISVKAQPDGRFEVISGHNRVEAFRALGRQTIPVVVIDLDDMLLDRSSFYANLLQPSLPDYEKYLGFRAERERTGKTQRQIAHEAGVAESVLSALFHFEQLPDEALAVLKAKPEIMGWSCAAQLAKLTEAGKGAHVVAAVQELAAGKLTQVAAVRYVKRAASTAPKATRAAEPVRIRAGRTDFCRITSTGTSLRIEFKDESHRAAAEAEIAQVLQAHADRLKPT